MRVIGTAGHVDHGKSTLVEALTGTHPDRLKEEREREMTIDLGFAWLTLPSGPALPHGEEVGIVDVPGHRDFIENMLAGVGGIDATLFVVAADEGVMPQTREHLAILDILKVQSGVIALTKTDLVDSAEWLDLVEDDLHQVLSSTALKSAPIVRVSARTGEGIPDLLSALGVCLAQSPPRPDLGRPRLPVDRVFTIAGFGTVVTGTLSDGRLRVGEEVVILPAEVRGRVRGLQTHKRKEEVAVPGSRTAVNISGLDLNQVKRGDVVAHPGDYHSTTLLDVRFRLLPDANLPLVHNTEVKFYIGAAEVVARVRLLGCEVLRPGEEAWLQLELRHPVVAVRGDRYILRRPSPGETLGGGTVVDPHPKKRYKRFAAGNLARLEALSHGTPTDIFLQALLALGADLLRDVLARSNLETEVAAQAVADLLETRQLVILEAGASADATPGNLAPGRPSLDALVTSLGYWRQLSDRAIQEVESYHSSYPLRRGVPREELKSRLKTPPRLFNAMMRQLVVEGLLEEAGPFVIRKGYQMRFNPGQERAVKSLLARFAAARFAPPSVKEAQAEVGDEIFNAMLALGWLVPVSGEVVFRLEDYTYMVAEIHQLLERQGTITAAEVRDHFNTSRRYVLALLEHLDAIGMTIREGDVRRLKA